jgi:hypothetical protein
MNPNVKGSRFIPEIRQAIKPYLLQRIISCYELRNNFCSWAIVYETTVSNF